MGLTEINIWMERTTLRNLKATWLITNTHRVEEQVRQHLDNNRESTLETLMFDLFRKDVFWRSRLG